MVRKGRNKLKLKQISDSVSKNTLVPIEQLGQRIKDIRGVLGITQKQLARKLKVDQSVISRIEDNIKSSELKTVSKILSALDCNFIVGISSKDTLEQKIKKQAEKRAKNIMDRTFSNMAMEKQAPDRNAYKYQYKKLVQEMIEKPGPELWED